MSYIDIYIDIETVPPPRDTPGLDAIIDHRVDKRLVDLEKIEAYRDIAYRNLSLTPIHGRILCAAWCVGGGPVISEGWCDSDYRDGSVADYDRVEVRILEALFDTFRSRHWPTAASYRHFDLHFIRSAAFRLGYASELRRLPGGPSDKWARNWLDLSVGWGDKAPPLADLARHLGETKAEGLTGSEVYPAFLRREYDRIRAYCEGDVAILRHVGERMGYYSIEDDDDEL